MLLKNTSTSCWPLSKQTSPIGFGIGHCVSNGQEGWGDVERQAASADAGLVAERFCILQSGHGQGLRVLQHMVDQDGQLGGQAGGICATQVDLPAPQRVSMSMSLSMSLDWITGRQAGRQCLSGKFRACLAMVFSMAGRAMPSQHLNLYASPVSRTRLALPNLRQVLCSAC